ncbi:MAG: DUF2785 domain-containing protein [Vicinamibacterales bacterium]
MSTRRAAPAALLVIVLAVVPLSAAAQSRTRDQWIALARGGFVVPGGTSAAGLLDEMAPLLASPDPVLRDEVAFGAAERWILRDRVVAPDELRPLIARWSGALDTGLGASGDDRIYGRSFAALCLSIVAARDVATPFLESSDARALIDRLFDYLARERDLRGFDATGGWMHAIAHTADALKFLARGRHWASTDLPRLLALMSAKAGEAEGVFQWGEAQRIGFALAAAVRRDDADTAAVERWVADLETEFRALWARGPVVAPRDFARVENRLQILRGLHTALAMDAAPTPNGEAARRAAIAALARMR